MGRPVDHRGEPLKRRVEHRHVADEGHGAKDDDAGCRHGHGDRVADPFSGSGEHDQHGSGERVPFLKIGLKERLPLPASGLADLRIAVTGQIDEPQVLAETEKIDELGPAGLFTGPGKIFAIQ